MNVKVLYKDSDNQVNKICDEIPFSCSVDVPDSKIDMQCISKISLESIEASIEIDTIAVKVSSFPWPVLRG